MAAAATVVKTGDGPEDFFHLEFPWELNNTDYLRRVLAHVTFAMRPVYEQAIRAGLPCEKDGLGNEISPETIDAYYALKHVRAHMDHYLRVLDASEDFLISAVQFLNKERNRLAHENLAGGVARLDLERSFGMAGRIIGVAGVRFAQDNLDRLQRQYDAHQRSKEQRRNAGPGAQRADTGAAPAAPARRGPAQGPAQGAQGPARGPAQGPAQAAPRPAPAAADEELELREALPEFGPRVDMLRQILARYKERHNVQMCCDLQELIKHLQARASAVRQLGASIAQKRASYDDAYANNDFQRAQQLQQNIEAEESQLQQLRDVAKDSCFFGLQTGKGLTGQGLAGQGLAGIGLPGKVNDSHEQRMILSRVLPLLLADGSAAEMKQAGFLKHLVQREREMRPLLEAGFKASELFQAGATMQQLRDSGLGGQDLRRVLQEVKGSMKMVDFRARGCLVGDLEDAGFSLPELLEITSPADLQSADAGPSDLAVQLFAAGASQQELKVRGCSVKKIYEAACSQNRSDSPLVLEVLRQLTAEELWELGFDQDVVLHWSE
ncbi:unnamed protein product [Symbiodinium natans]|uniref:Uncharacterized protein n=1 Tax=Symbiodinium natans TaxID=878477 RepID=A0A812RYI8_9DINO|nr:unnamed protein product [Symbiodinium natans]